MRRRIGPRERGKAAACQQFMKRVTHEIIKMEKLLRVTFKPKKEVYEISSHLEYEVEIVRFMGLQSWVQQIEKALKPGPREATA